MGKILLAIALLVVLVSPALAGDWVLWRCDDSFTGSPKWSIETAYPDYDSCDAMYSRFYLGEALVSKTKKIYRKATNVQRVGDGVEYDLYGEHHMVYYQCLPATIDPREKKNEQG